MEPDSQTEKWRKNGRKSAIFFCKNTNVKTVYNKSYGMDLDNCRTFGYFVFKKTQKKFTVEKKKEKQKHAGGRAPNRNAGWGKEKDGQTLCLP